MGIRLVEIGQDGRPVEDLSLPDVALSVCEATAAMYPKTGFRQPWVGYLAVQDGQVVGTCGFKTPPKDGRVEIAYFTFPGHEGKGIAIVMLLALLVFGYVKGRFTTAKPLRSAWQTVVVGGLAATAAFVIAKAIG